MAEPALPRVMILGAAGQVGRELARASWPLESTVRLLSRADLELTDRDAIEAKIRGWRPDVVVNAAAYTAVDRAESEPELAATINGDSVGMITDAAAAVNAAMIHFSTDYVFDGTADGWYVETDKVAPLSVYGRTKLIGERYVGSYERGIVLRTSWIYSPHGSNFIKTMRRLGRERDTISVIDDQMGCPTSAEDLAQTVATVVDAGASKPGLFHVAAPDAATWWDVADETLRMAGLRDGVDLRRIATEEYPTAAQRPRNSKLDSTAIRVAYGARIRPWRHALADVSARLDSVADVARSLDPQRGGHSNEYDN